MALIHAYQAIFGEGYGNLKAEIDSLANEIEETLGDKAIGAINTQIEQNKGAAEFWGKYCDLNAEKMTPPDDCWETLITLRDSATALLKRKAASLLEPVPLNPASKTAQAAYDQLKTVIAGTNKAINDANTQIKGKKDKDRRREFENHRG